jgi:hypothetical protein
MELERVVEKTSSADLMEEAARLGRQLSSALGALLPVLGELDRREAWRTEGAATSAAWLTQRLGVSENTGRAWSFVAERLWDMPHLAQGLRVGALSFDKVRAAVELATPETDASVLRQAEECTVRQLNDLVRAKRGTNDHQAAARHEDRYLRFNDARRMITAQLSEDAYAEVRGVVTDRARLFPSDGETRYDQRRADAMLHICREAMAGRGGDVRGPGRMGVGGEGRVGVGGEGRSDGVDADGDGVSENEGDGSGKGARSPSKFFVVAHTDLSFLRGASGGAEVERLGLLSREAIRRITCNATVTLALDDAFGHTMFEGRAKRFASETQRREVQRRDRGCRFPGCANNIFTDVHHVVHWADQGPTDLPNLVTLCDHHHHRVHESKWRVTGNANGTLRFVGPNGRAMTSRPSPLWTRRKD